MLRHHVLKECVGQSSTDDIHMKDKQPNVMCVCVREIPSISIESESMIFVPKIISNGQLLTFSNSPYSRAEIISIFALQDI